MPIQRSRISYPWIYRLFFLYIEPLSIFIGAIIAFFFPKTYLEIVHAAHTSQTLPYSRPNAPDTQILLSQLANVYILFALNEALVLRSTSDIQVWRTMQKVLLIADFGHLCIVFGLGTNVRWDAGELSTTDWGKPLLFAGLRIAFLIGVGLESDELWHE